MAVATHWTIVHLHKNKTKARAAEKKQTPWHPDHFNNVHTLKFNNHCRKQKYTIENKNIPHAQGPLKNKNTPHAQGPLQKILLVISKDSHTFLNLKYNSEVTNSGHID
jgi:hypothetical protein